MIVSPVTCYLIVEFLPIEDFFRSRCISKIWNYTCLKWKKEKLWLKRVTKNLERLLGPEEWKNLLFLFEKNPTLFLGGSSLLWALTFARWIPLDINIFCEQAKLPLYFSGIKRRRIFRLNHIHPKAAEFCWDEKNQVYSIYSKKQFWNWHTYSLEYKSQNKKGMTKSSKNILSSILHTFSFPILEFCANFDFDFCKNLWSPTQLVITCIPAIRDQCSVNHWTPYLFHLRPADRQFYEERILERNQKYKEKGYTILPASDNFTSSDEF
jgi:hypothetical protein